MDHEQHPTTIVPATPEDALWVRGLFRTARNVWPSGGDMMWWRYWSGESPSEHWDKAVVDDVPAGFAHWRIRKDGWRTLYEVVVDPARRGEGIGEVLVKHVGHPIRLKVLVDGGAEGFYRHLGFTHVGDSLSRNGRQAFRVYERTSC